MLFSLSLTYSVTSSYTSSSELCGIHIAQMPDTCTKKDLMSVSVCSGFSGSRIRIRAYLRIRITKMMQIIMINFVLITKMAAIYLLSPIYCKNTI